MCPVAVQKFKKNKENSDVFIAAGQHYSSYCRLNSSREIECSGSVRLVSFLFPE
jgi:hypothetical protein